MGAAIVFRPSWPGKPGGGPGRAAGLVRLDDSLSVPPLATRHEEDASMLASKVLA
jgi:hypothetical protein